MRIEQIVIVVTATLTALLSGVFFGYATSVIGGLQRLTDREYVRAMQSINQVIQNPVFLFTFIAPVILLPFEAFLVRSEATPAMLLLIASILYIAGSFSITMTKNVPLSDALARFDATNNSDNEVAMARAQFEKPWNHFHLIRTVSSVAATALSLAACALI
jgi:uncharacterized membrane protein